MHTSIMENKLDLDYKELLEDVLKNGIENLKWDKYKV